MTEQDVVNEEMYEEEDDDLPTQYRRLTAHLQTGSVDFNRRLAAYLTNQVAMRSAMDQMINNSYAQQYPHAPHFAHNGSPSSLSPALAGSNAAQSPTHATNYRVSPYPPPHQNGFPHPTHPSPLSDSSSSESTVDTSTLHLRRRSTPATTASPLVPRLLKTEGLQADSDHSRQVQSASASMGNNQPAFWKDIGPLTTALPPESQQMLGPGLDPSDPMTPMLMAGSEQFTSDPHYPWNPVQHSSDKTADVDSVFGGLYSTLAPSALNNADAFAASGSENVDSGNGNALLTPSGIQFAPSPESTKPQAISGFNRHSSVEKGANGLPSGQITPGEGFWDSFIQDGGWAAEAIAE